MSSEARATQVHLLRHQRTELPPTRLKENSSGKTNLDPKTCGIQMKITIKNLSRKMNMKTRNLTQDRFFKVKIDIINVENLNT